MRFIFTVINLIIFNTYTSESLVHGPLIWSDEFDYTGPPDPSKWSYWNNPPGIKVSNVFTNNNAHADGKHLIMTLKRESLEGKNYTGINIVTKRGFRYGYYEMRAKIARVSGTWSNFWFLGDIRKLYTF